MLMRKISSLPECRNIPLPNNIFQGMNSLEKLISLEYRTGPVLVVTTEFFEQSEYITQLKRKYSDRLHEPLIIADPNPDVEIISDCVANFQHQPPGLVIAVGGGSAIDFAKAIVGFASSSVKKSIRKILVDKSPLTLKTKPIPLIAIPTTSGTGAEVTQFATIWDKKNARKLSLESEIIRPTWVILDPSLTVSMPSELTLFTGLDTISHGVESLWNRNARETSRVYSIKSLELGISALETLRSNPLDIEARAKMQLASSLAGFGISITRTAIAHSISYPLTAHFGIPHGLACSFTIPAIFDLVVSVENRSFELPEIFLEAVDFVRNSNLADYILNFATRNQMLNKLDEMYLPERADNFMWSLTKSDVKKILDRSLRS